MSYTELFRVEKNGDVASQAEFRNAHGGAMFVWDMLCGAYRVEGPMFKLREGETDRYSNLWALAADKPEIFRPWEWNTLVSTYDNVVVTELQILAASFDLFAQIYDDGSRVCSLGAQADALRNLLKTDARGAAWNQTSVNCDYIWRIWDEDEDEERIYNIDSASDHWVAALKALDGGGAR